VSSEKLEENPFCASDGHCVISTMGYVVNVVAREISGRRNTVLEFVGIANGDDDSVAVCEA
jgi:hypothetical protein